MISKPSVNYLRQGNVYTNLYFLRTDRQTVKHAGILHNGPQ